MRTLARLIFPVPALLCSLQALAQQDNTGGWPLVFNAGGDQVQVFKPQPESFDGTSFTARAAVAYQRPDDKSPVFGAIWGNGTLAVDRSNRMGTLTNFKVTDARFPGISDAGELAGIKEKLSEGITTHAAPIAIDWLVASLDEEKQSTASYDNAPPTIIYKDKPSILLYIDGDPIYEPVKLKDAVADPVYGQAGPQLERVVNSPFLLVRPKGGANWLYGSGTWYSSRNIQGPWTHENKAPDYLEALAKQVDTTAATPRNDGIIPEVVVSMKPAVLLDVNGKPQMQPFDNSSLMYVTNTDKDLFMYIPTQEYYFLASGRWYATKDLPNGPWRYVAPEDLPADFAKVPEGSAKDGILAHVAGTPAAREAVRDAYIPQTATVDRGSATVNVTYDGSPQFDQIAGTSVYVARNASTTVLRINGLYHVCDNAVWYEGNSPDGPWTVSTSVPAEVNEIPPSDPAYRVRYVYIYNYTPDYVFTGYTPGYLGCYVQDGTVIYGTGYYYNPWRGSFWYPRPYTWGFNMYYNPWYGWSFGASWGYNWFYPTWNYYGYYRPYSWGWWGPYAYCPPPAHWHHHGYYGQHQGFYGHRNSFGGSAAGSSRPIGDSGRALRSTDLYDNHRMAGVRPTEVSTIRTARPVERTSAAGTVPARGKAAEPIRGDHFTDSKGNVFRNDNGRTEELRNGRWTKLEEQGRTPDAQTGNGRNPTAAPDRRPNTQPIDRSRTPQADQGRTWQQQQAPQQIERERMRGEQRTRDFRGYQQDRSPAPTHGRQSSPTFQAPQRSAPSTSPTPSQGGRSGGGVRRGGR
jgi:hypothetical protein